MKASGQGLKSRQGWKMVKGCECGELRRESLYISEKGRMWGWSGELKRRIRLTE